MQELLKSVYICRSYRKNSGHFYGPPTTVYRLVAALPRKLLKVLEKIFQLVQELESP